MVLLLKFLQEVLLEILLLEYLISLEVLLGNLTWWLEFLLLFLEFDWSLTPILYFGMVFSICDVL